MHRFRPTPEVTHQATNVIPAQAGTQFTVRHRRRAPYRIMNTPAMTMAMAGNSVVSSV